MATLLLSGTQLEPQTPSVPLNKPFLIAIGVIYLFAMHIFLPNMGGDSLDLPFNITTWIALCFALCLGLYQLSSYQCLRYSKLTIGLWVCSTILSLPLLFTNANWDNSLGRIIGLWAGYSLFLVLQQFHFSNKHKQRLLWYVVLGALIETFFALYQYGLLASKHLFDYSPTGIFQSVEAMASFLATGVVISGYLLARQPKKYNKKLSEITLLYVTPLTMIPIIIMSKSLIGWVSVGIGISLILPYLYRFSPRQRFINWLIAASIGILIGSCAFLWQNSHNVNTENELTLPTYSQVVPQALDMLIEKPFTGYGYGKFESQYILYTARQHQLNTRYPAGVPELTHPHNEILFWGVEGGLLPILGILMAGNFILFRIYSAKKGTRLAMFALLLPMLIHNLVDGPFTQSAVHWITFIILLFWIDQRVAKYRLFRFSSLSRSLLRLTSITLPVLATFCLLSILHTNIVLTQFEHSTPKNLAVLQNIINPTFNKDKLDQAVYTAYLNAGFEEEKVEYLQPYISWALSIIQSQPRPEYYINLMRAYMAIGDTSRAQQIKSEAEFLFPETDFSQAQSEPIITVLNNTVLESE